MASQRPALRLWKAGSQLVARQHVRKLTLHQHQSQQLLKEAGATIPRGIVARTAEEAQAAAKELGSNSLISAQNIKRNVSLAEQEASGLVARSPEQAAKITSELLNSSASDVITKEVYVSQPTAHEEVWYLAMTIDREAYRPAIIVSKNGGTDIRTIASQHPGSIFSYHLTLSEGITPALIRRIAADQGITSDSEIASLTTTLNALHKVFREKEGMLLEVRSLARANGTFTCLDSSFLFDDDAHKRQPELFALRDKAQEVGDEVEAEKYGLVYVRMDGNIGNVVNGAGLAMATNDAIGLAGGKSANFLDAGGQATTETMMKAFGIILRDERVKAILVNIYGGITRGDMIAESIIGAASEMDIHVPMVVRIQGTNSEAGLKLLADANLGLHVESDFGKAAEKAVELANA